MTVNKTTSDCTIYALVGTAILAISLVVAMYVGNDFHQSLFVESIIFVGSNILLVCHSDRRDRSVGGLHPGGLRHDRRVCD